MESNDDGLPIYEKLYSKKAKINKDRCFDYFSKSGLSGIDNPSHNPVIAFLDEPTPLSDKSEILNLPDDTKCMGQWRGENRSDYFQFTAGQYKEYVEAEREQSRIRYKKEEERNEHLKKEETLKSLNQKLNSKLPLTPEEQLLLSEKLSRMLTSAVRILRDDPTVEVTVSPPKPKDE